MGLLFQMDRHSAPFDGDPGAVFQEFAIDRIHGALLEAGQVLRQSSIQIVGQQRQRKIEIDLDHDGRRGVIELEEQDLLGNFLFHQPAACILVHDIAHIYRKVVGDQEGRFFSAMIGQNDLAHLSLVATQSAAPIMDPDALSLPLGPRQIDSLPLIVRDGFGLFDQFFASPPQGEELDFLRA